MADLQSNIEHLSNKIQGTFTSHEGNCEPASLHTLAHNLNALTTIVLSEEIPMETNDGSAAFHYDRTASHDRQTVDQGSADLYSNAPRANNRSQDPYNLSGDQTRPVENGSSGPNVYHQDPRDQEGEYIADNYTAEQEYERYSGYDPSQYQDEQYIQNGQQQLNVAAEQMEDNRTFSDATGPNAEISH